MIRLISLDPAEVGFRSDLTRSTGSRVFEERLEASIAEIGLVEPIKVCQYPDGNFVVVDGTMRLAAINRIRARDRDRFHSIPAYMVEYAQRFEIRFQTDIYQDLLPSQLAQLVEYLHNQEDLSKLDIARYIGVSSATLRNYTGLSRLLERRGLFAEIVRLMDSGIFPASNPYAWLRLNEEGVRHAIEHSLSGGVPAESWIELKLEDARCGLNPRYSIKMIEAITGTLGSAFYRREESVRTLKREIGLRRGESERSSHHLPEAVRSHLEERCNNSPDPVVRIAASSMTTFLR
ncbi:MAG: ParB N-terminal domain-containing protein [Actinomycetes bacterium]